MFSGTVDKLLRTADITFLLTSKLSHGSCGIAYFDTKTSPIALASAACAKGYYTFGHEIGHVLGAGHNKEASGLHGYDYSYGQLIEGGYRTIMA